MNKPKYNLSSAISSLNHNLKYRPSALNDIESDLESALKAVRELIAIDRDEKSIAAFNAGREWK